MRIAELLEELPKRPTLVAFAMCQSRALAEAAAQHAEFAIGFDGELDLRGLDRVHRPGPRHG